MVDYNRNLLKPTCSPGPRSNLPKTSKGQPGPVAPEAKPKAATKRKGKTPKK